jgi:hypothetical protein
MPDEPLETIDVRNNRESKAGASDGASRSALASEGGAPPRDAPAAGEMPVDEAGGTAAGSPVAGVTISEEDAQDAVKGQTRN